MLINAVDPEESRVAVVEDGVLQDVHVEIASREAYLGNIYKGKVVNIEPSIGAAFVSFGGRSNGFLHASDVLPAYARPDFQLSDVVEGRARITGEEGPDAVRAMLDDDDDGKAPVASGDGDDQNGSLHVADDHRHADADDAGPAELEDPRDADVDDDHDDREDHASVVEEAADVETIAADGEHLPSGEDGPIDALASGRDADRAAATAAASSTRKRRDRRPRTRTRTRVPIEQLLRKGQEVIVQVTKEGIGAKGPTLTTFISLPGRSLVLMPSLPKCGVSRKIEDLKERRRLKKIVRELDETGNGGVGFIVRTNGIEKSKVDLQRDRDYLKKIWEMISQRLAVTRAPALLYRESDLVLKTMRDLFSPEIEEVVVDSNDVFLRIRDFAEKLMPHMAGRIRLHELMTPVFHSYGIEADFEKLYQPRVELPNGGSIVIDQTEALVAIDVNSGRFKPGTNLEETAFRTNRDAIPEIVRQLRLRDLGGLIMIDFIDMTEDRHRRKIERLLIEALRGDRARIKVGRITAFGMLELTRQRVGPGLKHTVFNACTHCRGSGLVRTVQSKALTVLREIKAILNLKGFSILQVFAAPQVSDYLANVKRRATLDLEELAGKTVVIKSEPTYPIDVVHYRFMTADGQEARVAIPAGLGVRQ